MADILRGAPVVEAMNKEIANAVANLKRAGIVPTLAIVRVGDREDDVAYERSAVKRCEKVGVKTQMVTLPSDCTEDALMTALRDMNDDNGVHGVLLFRPLPKHMDDDRVRNALVPEKDVDGITDLSLAGVFTGTGTGYAPCTARACMEILDYYNIDPNGKKAVVVGRSLVVGKPVTMMLIGRHATVTVCHTRTADMPAECHQGEILIVSAGRPKMVNESYLVQGQVVVDVGINVLENGSMCGDVDFEVANGMVSAITPVPGGVGTVTTSVLVKNVVQAARKALEAQQ